MKRKDLIELILTKVQAEPVFEINKELISKKFRKTKNGIYFLYDENDIVIYVGEFGDGNYTSFYHRMYGHGSGAHCNKEWFYRTKKFRVKCFPMLVSDNIKKIERLMIYANNQPAFNDCYVTEEQCDSIARKL
ncbi:MAG: hypothetical protein K0S61_223 [Anaerocolumna sp.]|nr:hypothetical protein [Anaerocolumna sp.]